MIKKNAGEISRFLHSMNYSWLLLRPLKKRRHHPALPHRNRKNDWFSLTHIDPATIADQGIQAMIVAPSRELVLQIEQVFRSMVPASK